MIARSDWDDLKQALCASGDSSVLTAAGRAATEWSKERLQSINAAFDGKSVAEIFAACAETEFMADLERGSPISLRVALDLLRRARTSESIREALEHEFRFTARATEVADCLEGIRAVLIDRDNSPAWRYPHANDVPNALVRLLTSPLNGNETLFPKQRSEEVPL